MNWLQQLFSRGREYRNLSDEIAEHLQEKIEELISDGMSQEDASAAARRQFGNALLLEEHSREVWQWAVFDAVLRDLKYAFRQLRRNPGFTITVLLTLAVAIGANTAVFSMVNALLLRPLPYPQPEHLGSLVSHYEGIFNITGKATSEDDNSSDGETWELVRDNVPAVTAGATAGTRGVNLQIGSGIRYVREQRVSAGYLEALGVRPIFGRSFTKEEDRPDGAKVVVVSYEIWQSLLGADQEAIGKAIHLKGEPYTVVGVLPPHTETPDKADLLTPLRPTRTGEGEGNNYGVILRLRDGASWAQADAQLAPLHPEILQRRPTRARAWLYAVPLQKDFARDQGTPVYLLMSAVALVLLIACANLAGLMLVRVLRRRGEIATRLALGATPASVLRQLMTEPLVLTLVGGSIGVAMAANVLGLLARLAPPDIIPVGGLGLDHRVLWFAVAISLFSSLFIGILPALELRRMDLRSSITANASRSSSAAARSRMRQALIAGEVMLTVVLLAGAGLLIRTLVYLETLPPGFDATNVLTAQASLDDARYHDPVAFHKLLQQSVDAMKRIPGVESAAVGLSLPYERGLNNGVVILDGPSASKEYTSSDAYVTPEYFQSMRIPILSGRGFAESDSASSETVALVNFTFARKLLGSNDPVGRHIRSNGVTYTIVGMVADVTKRPGIIQTAPLATEAVFYVPATQMSQSMVNTAHIWFQPSWIVRTNGPVAGLSEAMQKALSDCDPSLPFVGFHSLSDIQALALQQQRFEVLLLGILAGLALLLSLVGVYGLVSNMVVQRTREIGVRMALGSSVRQAMVEVGTSGIAAVLLGLAGGFALSAVSVRMIKSELYGVQTYDPLTFVAVLLLLIIAAAAATFLPTRRIAQIDPASTLRAE
jgi:predicted permease